jgi:hypothetical protein
MPRESVRSADYHFEPVAEGVDPASVPWPASNRLGQVQVGWSKAPTGHVELCTSDDSLLNGPDGLFAQVAKAVKDGSDVEVVVRDYFGTGSGLWVTLDRDGCNDLIDLIRHARNDAFRRDA